MQEELIWFQKSRSKWLEFGDRNTRFFHGVTTIRRRKNHITTLQNDNGDWVHDVKLLENMATNYYKDLFKDTAIYPLFFTGSFS